MSAGGNDFAWDPEKSYAHYKVYDHHYEEIGKVDDLFVDSNDRPTYLGVKMGFLGTKHTLVPVDIVRVNDRRELVEVAESKEVVENAPHFDNVDELTAAQEAEIRSYYRLPARGRPEASAGYAPDASSEERSRVDLAYGERRGSAGERLSEPPVEATPETPARAASADRGEDVREEAARPTSERDDEIRIQRTEEELRAGTREREAGEVNVRKRVRTDREQLRVPKKREEVVVERVPVETGEASPADTAAGATPSASGDEEEIRIPVVEEEVVVEKRPVVKEEIRLRKRVVEEQAVVEEEVRKEEVEVDETDYRDTR